RKLYTLIASGYRRLGRPGEAMAACRAGRARCPDDAELLHFETSLRHEAGDWAGAEACLRQLARLQPGSHFASLDEGLRGPGARHQLGLRLPGGLGSVPAPRGPATPPANRVARPAQRATASPLRRPAPARRRLARGCAGPY